MGQNSSHPCCSFKQDWHLEKGIPQSSVASEHFLYCCQLLPFQIGGRSLFLPPSQSSAALMLSLKKLVRGWQHGTVYWLGMPV